MYFCFVVLFSILCIRIEATVTPIPWSNCTSGDVLEFVNKTTRCCQANGFKCWCQTTGVQLYDLTLFSTDVASVDVIYRNHGHRKLEFQFYDQDGYKMDDLSRQFAYQVSAQYSVQQSDKSCKLVVWSPRGFEPNSTAYLFGTMKVTIDNSTWGMLCWLSVAIVLLAAFYFGCLGIRYMKKHPNERYVEAKQRLLLLKEENDESAPTSSFAPLSSIVIVDSFET